MGCRNSKVVDANAKADPLMVPGKERKCRDIFWVLLFIAYLIGMVMVFMAGYQNGDAARLLYAIDSEGNQCGGKDSICYGGKPCGKNAVYPRVDKDFAAAIQVSGRSFFHQQKENLANHSCVPLFFVCLG